MISSYPNIKKNLLIIYLLGFYVILQFSWWAYLLVDLNTEITQQKVDLIHPSKEVIVETSEENLWSNLSKKKWMILGEGTIFLLLLIYGVRKTAKTVQEEFKLAQQQNNFLLSVTHELKSPLASSKLYLQTLLKRELPKEKQVDILSKSLSDNERLNSLVNNILVATKINNHGFSLHLEKVDLDEFLTELIEKEKIILDRREVKLINNADDAIIKADKSALASIFINLLENAIKYSPKDSPIEISLENFQKNLLVKIADQGNGIPDKEKKLIFEKFYRIGDENTRKSKGTGLGLFIVKHLLKLHNAQITVSDRQPKGSVFEISFSILDK